jgi:hypothetical protein
MEINLWDATQLISMSPKNLYLDLLGLAALLVFSIFTFISLALYPTTYTIPFNWLSNLGNIYLNPAGAIFFNWGCIITGFILMPFILSFYRWKPSGNLGKVLIVSAIIFGVFASISLIGVGIFPETHIKLHVLAASGVFESLFLIVILMTLSLFKHPKFIRSVAYIGFFAVVIDVLFVILLSLPQYKDLLASFNPTVPVPGLEWAAVFSSLIWIGALSYNMYKNKV